MVVIVSKTLSITKHAPKKIILNFFVISNLFEKRSGAPDDH